jgi:hypothetical protein
MYLEFATTASFWILPTLSYHSTLCCPWSVGNVQDSPFRILSKAESFGLHFGVTAHTAVQRLQVTRHFFSGEFVPKYRNAYLYTGK